MDILQLTYFKKIAELENVSKASEELMVAQPSLSKVIKTLETELDTKLFDRVGKKIVLNNNGRILLAHTNLILQNIEDARAEIMDSDSKLTGTVTISMQAATRMLPDILLGFRRLYPTIKIVVKKQLELATNIETDFHIFSSRSPLSDDNTITLLKEDCLMAMAKNHRLSDLGFVDMRDFINDEFIILQDHKSLSDMLEEYCHDAGFIPNISLECDHQNSVLSLIENNLGVSIIPLKTWNVKDHDGIILKPIRNKNCVRYINLRQRSNGYLSKAALLFKDYLIDLFASI